MVYETPSLCSGHTVNATVHSIRGDAWFTVNRWFLMTVDEKRDLNAMHLVFYYTETLGTNLFIRKCDGEWCIHHSFRQNIPWTRFLCPFVAHCLLLFDRNEASPFYYHEQRLLAAALLIITASFRFLVRSERINNALLSTTCLIIFWSSEKYVT
jgi:hypothetical protein